MARRKGLSSIEHEFYKRHADLCKVFSHPTRLSILNILREEEMSVSQLAERLGVGIGNLSQHLNIMKQRQVLVSRKVANNVYYRLGNAKMLKAFDLIREILREQIQRESVLIRHLERPRTRSRRAAS